MGGDSSLWYNQTNNRLGIGLTNPSTTLQVAGTISSTASITEKHTNTGFQYKESLSDHVAQSKKSSNTYGYYWRTSDDGTSGGANLKNLAEWYDDRLIFYTNGSERLRITGNGDIGIGVSTPQYKLDVNGAIANKGGQNIGFVALERGAVNASGYLATFDANSTRVGYVGYFPGGSYRLGWTDAALPIVIGTNDIERLRIDGNGNVGINTTPSGSYKLQVNGSVRFGNATEVFLADGVTDQLIAKDASGSLKWVNAGSVTTEFANYLNTNTQTNITTRINSGSWQTTSATTTNGWPVTTNNWYHLLASTHSNNTNYFSMQIAADFFGQDLYYRSTNNIGTQAWNRILLSTNYSSYSTFSGIVTGTAFVPTGATVPTNGLYLPATNRISFATASTERLTINSAGFVGINTSSPSEALDVNGAITNRGGTGSNRGYISLGAGTTTSSGFVGTHRLDTTRVGFTSWWDGTNYHGAVTDGATPLVFGTNGAIRLTIDANGNVGINRVPIEGIKLHVEGITQATQFRVNVSGANEWGILSIYRSSASVDNKIWEIGTADTNAFTIRAVNDAYNTAGYLVYAPRTGTTINFANFSSKVGIGLSQHWATPNGQLHVYEASGTPASATFGTLVLDHGNNGGQSSIVFPSRSNNGSDYGYIAYKDHDTSYNTWVGPIGTTENGALIIGAENDAGVGTVSDWVALRGAAANIFDSPQNVFPQGAGSLRLPGSAGQANFVLQLIDPTLGTVRWVNSSTLSTSWNGGTVTNPITAPSITLNNATGAQVSLTGTTSNWIQWNTNGLGTPTFTTRSVGTKLVLYPNLGASAVDYAIGIQSGALWNSVESTSSEFKWYGGTTQAMSLTGTGVLTTNRFIASSSDTAGAPGFTWSGETNTGMYRPSTNSIGFTVNGSEVARLVSSSASIYQSLFMGSSSNTSATIRPTAGSSSGILWTPSNIGGSGLSSGSSNSITCFAQTVGSGSADILRISTNLSRSMVYAYGATSVNLATNSTGQISLGFDIATNPPPVYQTNNLSWKTAVNSNLGFYATSTGTPWGFSYPTNGGSFFLSYGDITGTNFEFQTNGSFFAKGNVGAYYTISDKRLKTNVEPISSALAKINKVTGFTFDYNEKAYELGKQISPRDVGVFAQDVKEILPEAVELAPFDRNTDGTSKSGENYLMVHYEKIVPLLLEAVKELSTEVNTLKAEIEQLKKQ